MQQRETRVMGDRTRTVLKMSGKPTDTYIDMKSQASNALLVLTMISPCERVTTNADLMSMERPLLAAENGGSSVDVST